MIKIKIDNIDVTVPKGTTILEAAKKVNVNIPHLCYHPDQAIKANCRICVVEVAGSKAGSRLFFLCLGRHGSKN